MDLGLGVLACLRLSERDMADRSEQRTVIEPIHAFERGAPNRLEGPPRPASMDRFALDRPITVSARALLFLMEVVPALARPFAGLAFCGRLLGPRDTLARRKTFTLDGWQAVMDVRRLFARIGTVEGLGQRTVTVAAIHIPKKADRDRLDAVPCTLIGLPRQPAPREASIMIGERTFGQMVAPADADLLARPKSAADNARVPIAVEISDCSKRL